MCVINVKVATEDMAVKDNWVNGETVSADLFQKDFNCGLKYLYLQYKDMCDKGNLMVRLYCGQVLFYEATLNSDGIVEENRYLIIGQKFSNSIKYHSVAGSVV